MDLSLNEASTLLGRSVRQLRYQLQKGEIKGSNDRTGYQGYASLEQVL